MKIYLNVTSYLLIMELKLPIKKIIVNGPNRILILPKIWLLNQKFPKEVCLKIDDTGNLIISPAKDGEVDAY